MTVAWLLIFQAWHWRRQTRIRHQRSPAHPHEGSIPLDDLSASGPETSDDAHRTSQSSSRRNRQGVQNEEAEAVASGSDGDGTFHLPRRRSVRLSPISLFDRSPALTFAKIGNRQILENTVTTDRDALVPDQCRLMIS